MSPERARAYDAIPALISSFEPVIDAHLAGDAPLPERTSWRHLKRHAELCRLLAPALRAKAAGEGADAVAPLYHTLEQYAMAHEEEIHRVFQAQEYLLTVRRILGLV